MYELGMLSPTQFQSTLPARGATNMPDFDKKFVVISIHAPRTGSDDGTDKRLMDELISIHAPRTGSDLPVCVIPAFAGVFQSTLPARGATVQRSVIIAL